MPSQTASGQLDIGNEIYGTGLTGTGASVSSGSIGIGTTSPAATFSVTGNGYFTGNATIGGALDVGGGFAGPDPWFDTAATDTIDYVATDQHGLTSTSTRTVIIKRRSTVPTDAASSSATASPSP